MNTHFLKCLTCNTVIEVPSVNKITNKIRCIIKNIGIENEDLSYLHKIYDRILPSCCNNPIRRCAYSYDGFPQYHKTATRKEYTSYIKKCKLKHIRYAGKEFERLIITGEVIIKL